MIQRRLCPSRNIRRRRLEWLIDTSDVSQIRRLRHEFGQYLIEHTDVDAASLGASVLVFSELVTNVYQHGQGPAAVELAWDGKTPTLSVTDSGPGFDVNAVAPGATPVTETRGRGLHIVEQLAGPIETVRGEDGGGRVSVRLPLSRAHDPVSQIDDVQSSHLSSPKGQTRRLH